MSGLPPLEGFQYQYAEAHLDQFARTRKSASFKRSYRKFKFLLFVYAYLDFSAPNKPTKQHMAWAWEDAQIAFKGFGETMLHGAILQMWSALGPVDQAQFLRSAEEAFCLAECETDREANRRYIKKYRNEEIRDPSEGFTLPSVMPVSGAKLKDWLKDEGFSPDQEGEFMEYIREKAREDRAPVKSNNHLRVYEGGSKK
jgi:hypothetical protein